MGALPTLPPITNPYHVTAQLVTAVPVVRFPNASFASTNDTSFYYRVRPIIIFLRR